MGEVWRAKDTKLGREVAIKVLPEEFTRDADRLARFEREARVLASIDHSQIAAIYGLEEIDGVRFLVMQLAEGEDLSDRIARQGAIPVDEAVEIAKQIAGALEVAHEQGIVHRDLKPANIKVDEEGKIRVLDFGLAKAYETEESDEDFANSPTMVRAATHDGVILGTAGYMSPEQARGKAVDRRADIWAFGVLLWEMITGRRLFAGDTISDTLAAVLREEIDWNQLPADTPANVARVLRLCLERNPRNRLHDIADARLLLESPSPEVRSVAADAARSRMRPWLFAAAGLLAGLIATALVLMAGSREAPPVRTSGVPSISMQRLTELPGAELHPSLSPDGRMVVYASALGGNLDLYLLRVGGDRPIPLTTHPADDSQAVFSPDGESIAFRSERDGGGIFVMGATGESVRRVTSTGYDPAWSPNGAHLAFTTEPVSDPYARNSKSELWVVDVQSGKKRQIPAADAIQPSWSPDGRWIAFWENNAGQRDVLIVPAEGGEAIHVTRDTPTDWSPRWAPEGGWLYFSSDRGGSMNLWRVAIDSESGAPTTEPQMLTGGVEGFAYPSFSKDGSRFAVMAYERNFEHKLYAIDPANPTRAVLEHTIQTPSASLCYPSPDGTVLACRTDGVPEDLILVRADGSEMRRLTSDSAKDRNAMWAPNGRELVFMSTLEGPWENWLIRLDGSGRRKLTDGFARFGTWSPDGQRMIASPPAGGGREIGLIDVEQGGYEELEIDLEVPPEHSLYLLSWSDRGNRVIVVESDAAGIGVDLRILNVDDGSVRDVDVELSGTGYDLGGNWFPDGRHLVVRTPSGVTVVDTESGQQNVLFPLEQRETRLRMSLDGTTIHVEREILSADIWLIELEEM